MITAKWNEGVLDLSAGDYKEEKRRMLGRQQQLMTSVSVLRTMGAQLAGRWTDDMVLSEREVLDDWAHIDDTISRYTNVPEATKNYERLLDTARAVILPASNDPDETELKFYLLTSDIGRASTRIWGDMLNGRELNFKNEFRPSKKYLYFKFVISLLRRRRIEVPGFENDLVNLPSPSKVMWASPGSYMKKSILYKFSRQLGCISVEEANRFWEVPEAPTALPAELEDLATTLALTSSSSMSAEISESETGEEADDDDPFSENEGDDDIVNSEDEE
ncbi:hypothetical protein CMQ_8213 [Grosmannia clavigera kw1407]|uniref:Uncharacterized protein n=1 Tax=Grosmannia clavigera (strain kw1407 / UAMH 11150) TaxID=655863 RepID=F0XKW6_GROCL|nr:uncharacterized protein CMQ_8213 [Grosmannia clavigera kw1407]EFX01747.1 hypothetical protein CMQ_8213 [Grosmannia clavigera kw1407]